MSCLCATVTEHHILVTYKQQEFTQLMVPKAEESDGRAASGQGFLAVSLYGSQAKRV